MTERMIKFIVSRLITVFAFSGILLILFVSLCKADVVEELVPLIIQAESSNNPNATDGKSFGLMGISPISLKQVNEVCGSRVYVSDLYDPVVNVWVGKRYLEWIQKHLPEEYRNDKKRIVSAYNNGIGWLKEYNWNPPTQHKNKIYNSIYKGEIK